MSSVFSALRRLIPFAKPKGLIGYDLQGNRYFEIPNPAGGRTKRFVEYAVNRDIAEYGRADLKPPVQWKAWLSHTRTTPPTVQELEHDYERQISLLPKVAAIEAREREERIRQGYLLPDGSELEHPPSQIGAPSTSTERKAQIQKFISSPQNYPTEAPKERSPFTYPVPTPQSQGVASPRKTIDPSTASAKELRKLAEEDTKRRIAQTGNMELPQKDNVQSVQMGKGGLEPRRRSKK
ncbi:hypothetical protein J010_04510 [Cryptococcus neoformans]|nr:hypothetical protein C355_04577 [Cryptococcus neoformans var. grubii Th84]OXH06638.1 hypothetical protein J010_04510 [Cryptococcus neoformans var. grubii]OXH28131.1 hypothetical protein J009_04531 [Cryptococcus neoformans var. grubii]OXH47981.1 hypothetical protein J004_04583 [Cryptococcus neoformans var. grubii]OXH48660.1 hypothetical protein J003_04506 [Cryptococcus neoformans var. grubii]